jgi:hypothetical protein
LLLGSPGIALTSSLCQRIAILVQLDPVAIGNLPT